MSEHGPGRFRRHWKGFMAAAAAAAALGLTTTFTLGGFSATIQNNTSTFSSATVAFSEALGGTTCYNTGAAPGTVTTSNTNTTCAINMLSAGTLDQIPGGTALTQTATVSNTGNHTPSTASLVLGTCSAAAASDANSYVGNDTASYCSHVDITIFNVTTGKCMYPYSASVAACAALSNTYNLSTVAGDTFAVGAGTPSGTSQFGLSIPTGGGVQYTVTTQLDNGVATNGDQGLAATMSFAWSISQ